MVHAPTVVLLPALDGVVVTAAGVEAFDCPVCETVRDLVIPVGADDAGPDPLDHDRDDCPDRACAVCGFGLAVGIAPLLRAADHHPARRAG